MSRAFVKEENPEAIEELPDKPISPHPNYVTPKGMRQLKERLLSCLEQERALKPLKDLASRQELPVIRREIRYLERRMENAIVVDLSRQPKDRVHFGAIVEVEDEQGQRHTFHIVGEDEAEAASGRISWVSPLSTALLDAQVGDIVNWKRPAGDMELEVIAIHRGQ